MTISIILVVINCITALVFSILFYYVRDSIKEQIRAIDQDLTLFNRKIAGICGGIAEITKIDPVFLRLLMIFVCALTGFVPLILAYLIGWMIIPESPN